MPSLKKLSIFELPLNEYCHANCTQSGLIYRSIHIKANIAQRKKFFHGRYDSIDLQRNFFIIKEILVLFGDKFLNFSSSLFLSIIYTNAVSLSLSLTLFVFSVSRSFSLFISIPLWKTLKPLRRNGECDCV